MRAHSGRRKRALAEWLCESSLTTVVLRAVMEMDATVISVCIDGMLLITLFSILYVSSNNNPKAGEE